MGSTVDPRYQAGDYFDMSTIRTVLPTSNDNYSVSDQHDQISNSSENEEMRMIQFFNSDPEAVIVPVLFGLIFVTGIVGNGTLILTVLRNKNMRNVPNIFVVSLSIGDLLLLLFSAPFSSTYYTFYSWPFGDVMCRFNEFMQTCSVGVSVFTLTALSGDRYKAIVDPMSKHTGKPTMKTVVTVIIIWILSILFAIPDALGSGEVKLPEQNGTYSTYCDPYGQGWPSWYKMSHPMNKFVVYFLIPVFIIGIFYLSMARILVQSSHQIPCEATGGSQMNQQHQRQVDARIRVAKIVLSFVIIFIVCWLPRHIYLLWFHYDPGEYSMFWHVFKILGFCLTYVYTCVNPFALYFLSSQFRKYYNRYLCCCCPRKPYAHLEPTSNSMFNFNSTVRRASTSMTIVQSQSMC